MEKLNVEVNLTAEDIYKFQKSYLGKIFAPALIIILGIAVMISVLASIGLITGERFSSGGVVFFLIVLIFIITIPITLRRSSYNIYKTNKLLQKTQNYTIGKEGIEAVSENGSGFIKWEELYKAVEVKESFLLFISQKQSYIIPKRYLGSSEELELMRAIIKNAPIPRQKKNILSKALLFYIILFVVILAVLALYQAK